MATQGRTQAAPADEHRSTNEIMDAIRSIVRALRVNTRAIEIRLGISLAQLWVLQLLEARPSQSVNDLAEATATHQSSVSVVVRRLVDRGLVTRTMAVEDRRRVRVDITDAGRDLLRKAPTTVQVALLGALRRMAPEPRQNLANLMRSWLSDAGLDLSERPPMLMEEPDEAA
jgi:DNA-binding MarR family transcriptional regulator